LIAPEPVVFTTSDFAELVLAMLGVAARLERSRIMERTARGRPDAKAKGVRFGRKPTLTPHQQRSTGPSSSGRAAAQCCPELQRQPSDDISVGYITYV
jgi:DNA invertase Pin-like site-specific DNA recombinase